MERVSRIPVAVPTRAPGGETNAYVVGTEDAVLVDPAARSDRLDRAVRRRNVAHVAVTHTHPDHVGAVADYAAETGATVWARRGHAERFAEATGIAPDRTLAAGTVVGSGDAALGVLDTPGHARDHVAFVVGGAVDGGDGPATAVLCGDLAVATGSVVVGAPEGDLRAYLTALRRLRAMAPDRLLPGHGPVITDPRATCERLVAHRLDRERRVLAAVREGATDLDAVLAAAYDKDLTGVADLARRTVACHLEKLAVEGQVSWDGDRASLPR